MPMDLRTASWSRSRRSAGPRSGLLSEQSASGHIVSLRHPTAPVEDVQAALADEHRIITSSRVGGIRVSLHLYNSEDDVRTLAEALESIGRHST